MPNAYILNQLPTSYGQALSLFVEMLVGAGWSYKASGDGLAGYSATGKIFTGTGAGALGWSNARAWARLAMPDGVREIVVQHNAAAALRLKYSRVAKFIGGAPSATVTPSATDERYIQGGATDAAPTYCTAFYSTGILTSLDRFQGAAMSAAPYGFWIGACRTPGGASVWSVLMLDPVVSVPEDPDPYVWYACRFNLEGFRTGGNHAIPNTTTAGVAPGASNFGVWAVMDTVSGNLVTVDPMAYASSPYDGNAPGYSTSGNVSLIRSYGNDVNPFNLEDDALPIQYGRIAAWPAPNGLKGWSTFTRWTGVQRNAFVDTLRSRQWICAGNVWLPWDGITVSLN
jgi:hypothetical protein